jgi:hypothetical protein
MRKLRVLVPIAILVLSYMVYTVITLFGPFNDVTFFGNENCKRIVGAVGVEDFVWYQGVLLGSSDDRAELWERNNLNIDDGAIVLIDIKSETTTRLPIEGFPPGVRFHPHGVSLYEDTIYVINHAYQGGERVDVLRIHSDPWRLEYVTSARFEDRFLSNLNDLVVVAPGRFYITQYLSDPADPILGRDHSILAKMKIGLEKLFVPLSYVHLCDIKEGRAKCVERVASCGMCNGVSTDGTDLFVVDSYRNTIKRYQRNNDYSLTLIEKIPTTRSVDNMDYNESTGEFHLGGVARIVDVINFVTEYGAKGNKLWKREDTFFPGGALKMHKTENGSWTVTDLLLQNDLLAVSAATRQENWLVLGSWFDDGWLKCEITD